MAAAPAGLRDTLRDDAGARTDPSEVTLSDREIDVLARLERQTDKQIAEALKLSFDGVRSRVRSIFAKLGAYGRREAVHCARARCILPPAEEEPGAGDSRMVAARWPFRSPRRDMRRPHSPQVRWVSPTSGVRHQ